MDRSKAKQGESIKAVEVPEWNQTVTIRKFSLDRFLLGLRKHPETPGAIMALIYAVVNPETLEPEFKICPEDIAEVSAFESVGAMRLFTEIQNFTGYGKQIEEAAKN